MKPAISFLSASFLNKVLSSLPWNATTQKSVDGWFMNVFPFQYFTTIANTPFETEFSFTVPDEYKGKFEIILVAQANKIKDSIRFVVPVINK